MMNIERQFILGFIQIHILYHASKEPVYGVWLISELARHGYELSPGTIYPILHNLKSQGYLKAKKKTVNGKVRKYYKTTPEGNKALSRAKARVKELVDEILLQ